jgi:calcium-dependent protein kinase
MQAVNHPNIIDLVEIHESQNSLYLVMELLEGGEIFSLSKGKLDNESTFSIIKNILKALVILDKHGVMHRDLKPDNIILKKKNVPIKENILKLVDFGLATYQDVDEYLFKRCGTPGFVAPEVINAKRGANVHYSTKCDVFSVGIIFFFMLTGKIPYDGADFQEVLDNNKKATINFNVKELKYVTPIANDLLRNMLEINPEDRPTALECLKHEYFVNKEASLIMDDDQEEGIDLSENLTQFKEKYRNVKQGGVTDSIHFNANPTMNGVVDTYGSINASSNKSGNIDSFNSVNRQNKP